MRPSGCTTEQSTMYTPGKQLLQSKLAISRIRQPICRRGQCSMHNRTGDNSLSDRAAFTERAGDITHSLADRSRGQFSRTAEQGIIHCPTRPASTTPEGSHGEMLEEALSSQYPLSATRRALGAWNGRRGHCHWTSHAFQHVRCDAGWCNS